MRINHRPVNQLAFTNVRAEPAGAFSVYLVAEVAGGEEKFHGHLKSA
jgi:hypothetical protein